MILHTDELRPAISLGAELHLSELVCPHAAGAYVAHFTRLYEVVEGFHCFFNGDGGIESMDLEKVDVGGVETAEGGFYCGEDGVTRETFGV
jgi:hypothetical protein